MEWTLASRGALLWPQSPSYCTEYFYIDQNERNISSPRVQGVTECEHELELTRAFFDRRSSTVEVTIACFQVAYTCKIYVPFEAGKGDIF